MQRLSDPLGEDQVVQLDSQGPLRSLCKPNFRGYSGCYAIVLFNDSPLSTGVNNTWNYTIQVDPVRSGYQYNVHRGDNDIQIYHLPVQLAVDNAITDATDVPSELMFSSQNQSQYDYQIRIGFLANIIQNLAIVFFISMLPFVYHVVNVITSERESGVSALIDAMGGSPASRLLSYIASFFILYLPSWIIFGTLYWYLIFPESNAAIFIFWQLLSGMAIVTASVLAATFFKTSKISSVFVCVCVCCLAGGAAILVNRRVDTARVIALSLLFPGMNYIFAITQMARFPLVELPVDINTVDIPTLPFIGAKQTYYVAVWVFLVLLVVQILVYPVLAILCERAFHGVNTTSRTLSVSGDSAESNVAVRVTGLSKVYTVWWKQMFGIKDADSTKALDNLDLIAHKRQILCLLGANGAGKSTTLDILAGAHRQTSGEVTIYAPPEKLGICPQRNVLFSRLTVYEHVQFWSQIKGGHEDKAALEELIEACDLTLKKSSQAAKLSGGQKRKLQLACMFVGGSTVCLMDEVTSGLDPLSRRAIWNIILAERAKRSMVFTTHFLDEADVLADHIVILSQGHPKCVGTGAELKNRYGGGYRVYIPQEIDVEGVDAPKKVHQDHVVYTTPDSKSAAKLVAQLEASGHPEIQITGPTIEDVFLKVAQADVATVGDGTPGLGEANREANPEKLSDGQTTTFFQQVRALMIKRLHILPRYWIAAFLALALPIACMPPINVFIDPHFTRPTCDGREVQYTSSYPLSLYSDYAYSDSSFLMKKPLGPPSANQTAFEALKEDPVGYTYKIDTFWKDWEVMNNYDAFVQYVGDNRLKLGYGGIYTGDSSHGALVAHGGYGGPSTAMTMLNLYTGMRSGVKIQVSLTSIFTSGSISLSSWQYLLYANFIFAVFPAFFALYPAYERSQQIRSLQYSNGVRPLPLWASYFLFDLCFVVAISIAYTVTISLQFPSWWKPEYMFPVCLFYGISLILFSYIISTRAKSQLSSFLWTIAISVMSYFALALAYGLPVAFFDVSNIQKNTDAISFSLDLIFPIGSMFRAMSIGLNTYQLACHGDSMVTDPGSWWAYGCPIAYLILQIIVLAVILIWMDGDLSAVIMKRSPRSSSLAPGAGSPSSWGSAVEKEAARVEQSDADLLRLVRVSKSYGKHLAVDNVSLGLGESEIVALLGPNGAGKTTIVNMIRADMTPSSGHIYLRDVDVVKNPRLAQKSMGVCPQFDALDLLTTRQHLEFYGRIKGIPDFKRNAELVMRKVGLLAYASKQASALSGGNKRKLSLGIALVGNPAVLILDEPSSSMDAVAKRMMWRILEEVAPGRSLLLTTHSMEEADALATRAAILSQRLLAIGTTQNLRKEYANLYHVQLVLRTAPLSTDTEMASVESAVRDEFVDVTFEGQSLGGQIKFMVPSTSGDHQGRGIGDLINWLEEHREELSLQDYSIGAPTLERVFLNVVKDGPAGHIEV
ncbi:P-loop containing nucleoside triphosphate hydrolase protein [Thozetella sp. PMI_491]|nr:P-loop containing nucleoside triphosphate hydrolase protein [Thozetella sp. PMI_491]